MSDIKFKHNVKRNGGITANDLDKMVNPDGYKLFREAIYKAGSVDRLAEVLGVTIETVNSWLFPVTPSYKNLNKIREFIRNGVP